MLSSLFSSYSQGDELRDAARSGDVPTIKRLLSETTGLVFSADQDGYIPLICASMEGHTEAATLLLNIGGNVHHETKVIHKLFLANLFFLISRDLLIIVTKYTVWIHSPITCLCRWTRKNCNDVDRPRS